MISKGDIQTSPPPNFALRAAQYTNHNYLNFTHIYFLMVYYANAYACVRSRVHDKHKQKPEAANEKKLNASSLSHVEFYLYIIVK